MPIVVKREAIDFITVFALLLNRIKKPDRNSVRFQARFMVNLFLDFKSVQSGEVSRIAQLLLNAQQLVVLGHTV